LLATFSVFSTPAVWLQQHTPDDLQVDVTRLEEFDGRYRIPILLHEKAVFDDFMLAPVEPWIGRFGYRQLAHVFVRRLIHRDSFAGRSW
jgi:hypothetical protein